MNLELFIKINNIQIFTSNNDNSALNANKSYSLPKYKNVENIILNIINIPSIPKLFTILYKELELKNFNKWILNNCPLANVIKNKKIISEYELIVIYNELSIIDNFINNYFENLSESNKIFIRLVNNYVYDYVKMKIYNIMDTKKLFFIIKCNIINFNEFIVPLLNFVNLINNNYMII